MEIVIDESGNLSKFGVKKIRSRDVEYAEWVDYYIPWAAFDTQENSIDARREIAIPSAFMYIIPAPGKEEKVERFVAIGRMQNKNFPFCIANSKDYSKIDSE